ncbi:MAG: tetratricopeptide repeat protein [Phycisphaerales bacterium]
MSQPGDIKSTAADVVTEVVKKVSVEGMIAGVGVLGTICTGGALPVVTSVAGIVAAMALFGALKLKKAAKDRAKDDEQAKHCERVGQLLEQLKHGTSAARDQLADIALQQEWFKNAISQGSDAFNEAWKSETAACADALKTQLTELKADTTQIQATLAELAHLGFDMQWRIVDLQKGQAKLLAGQDRIVQNMATAAQVEELKQLILAQRPANTEPDEATRRDLAHGMEILAQRAERGDELAARAIADRNPSEAVDALVAERARIDKAKRAAITKVEETELALDRSIAATAYLTGRIDEAEAACNRIFSLRPDDLDATNQLGHVMHLRGNLDEAKRLYTRVGELATNETTRAVSFGNLGLIEKTRGNLDAAEDYHKKSLAIEEKLGRREGMASDYGNLGNIELTRGNLDTAEEYLKKAMAIHEKLGRQEGMASDYANLGLIEQTRGNLDAAEEYLKQALAIHEKLGMQEGMAAAYGNLGLIEITRGNLDAAEEYHKKSLTINEKLGRQEGMAIQYGNLGLIERSRGNLDAAEEYHKKSLAIEEKLGRLEGMAADYGNLGVIERSRGNLDAAEAYYKKSLDISDRLGLLELSANQYGNLGAIELTRGNLDAAETYLKKALAINEKLGRPEGMAIQYGNLGLIERTRGNLDAAEEYHKKALAINEKLGRPEGMAIQYSNLGLIERTRGNINEARRLWTLSRDLFKKIGARDREALVQSCLTRLPPA